MCERLFKTPFLFYSFLIGIVADVAIVDFFPFFSQIEFSVVSGQNDSVCMCVCGCELCMYI